MVVLKAAGVRLSRAAAGRERSELALDRRMSVAYPVLMSQHAPRPDAPDTSPRPPPIMALLPAAGRPIPDDGRRAGGGSRVTGSGVGIVALPIPVPILVPPPAASRPHAVPEHQIPTGHWFQQRREKSNDKGLFRRDIHVEQGLERASC